MEQQVVDRGVQEKREAVKFGRAFLIAAAVSTPVWVLVAAGLHLVAVFS